MLNITLYSLLILAVTPTAAPDKAPANPVFQELLEKGIAMSDGKAYKLPQPAMGDGLSADEQKAVIEKIGKAKKYTFDDLTDPRTAAPVVLVIRTLKDSDDETSIVRSIDLYFIAHGKWDVLNSKEFLDSLSKPKDGDNPNEVVSKSGFLTDEEMKNAASRSNRRPNGR